MTAVTRAVRILFALTFAALSARAAGACIAVAADRVTARDLAESVPVFSPLPADTDVGYAPVPGARRYYHAAELRRLALRYNLAAESLNEICIERAMEPLAPEGVIEAMRQALGNPEAGVEIVELSRYPVPRGDIEFTRASLPPGGPAAILWRGFVRYGSQRRFAIWARVKVTVQSTRIVATQNLPAGQRIEVAQVRVEPTETFPTNQPAPSLDQVLGLVPRRSIAAGAVLTKNLLDTPKEVERGAVVEVEVHSGGARLALEGRAQNSGRRGDAIPIRNLATGKSFSARVAGKDRVVLTTVLASRAKDIDQ
jgi:flagella basal body P-ring formation protein FlgA